jgi:RimJ/RimL family protein N-acetyltransferase
MITLLPLLEGQHVRLEPLQRWHARGLAEASSVDPSLYRWSPIPQGEAEALAYIETALAQRDAGVTAPFAVLRIRDDAVIGSSRLWDLGWWPWPEGHPRQGHEGPDVCEIGYTWLTSSAIGTAANTEMKLLLLTHAFEVWEVQSVCFHTDARNERSRAALERIGARFEGVLRAHRLATDDRPRNSARYSITAPEWLGVKHHLQMLLAARERALQL